MCLLILQENRVEMWLKLLQLSLYVVTVIQLTSSQSTYDVNQQDNDVSRCEYTDQVLNQLMTAVSQLHQSDANSSCKSCTDQVLNQLMTTVSQLQQNVSQLQHNDANGNTGHSESTMLLSQLVTIMSQMQKDVAELKAANVRKNTTGKLRNQKDETR